MVPVSIGLGSNLGDRVGNVRRAVEELRRVLCDMRVSALYATSPMYVTDQPEFVNAVAQGFCCLSPRALLACLKAIEDETGRQAGARFGPRLLDLDLLTYGALSYRFEFSDGKSLELPHPRMSERRFVMEPLSELSGASFDPKLFPGQQASRLANEDSLAGVQ